MKLNGYFLKSCLILYLTLFVLNSCIAQKELYSTMFNCSKKMESPYAICSHINRKGSFWEYDSRYKDIKMIDNVGSTMVRTDFDRTSCQKNYDAPFDYTLLDSMMAAVSQSSINMLGLLSPNRSDMSIDTWLSYVYNTVLHYKKKIHYWEVMNEVDRIHTYQPDYDLTEYPSILKKVYSEIKRANPKAIVLYTGASSIENGFVEMTFKKNIKNSIDIMNMHVYTSEKTKPERLLSFYQKLSNLMQKYQINKPLWITETGFTTVAGNDSEIIQAEYLPRIYLISFACGVNKVFWYKSRSNELEPNNRECFFGLWHKDYMPKPAYYAYQTLTKMCPNKATRPVLQREGDIYFASWKRADGNKVWALWTSENRTKKISLSISKKYEAFNLYGEKVNIAPNNVEVSSSVLYIVGAKNIQIRILN